MNGLGYTPVLETDSGVIPLNYSIERTVEDSDGQVAQTIGLMCRYVCEDYQAGPIVDEARLAASLSPDDLLAGVHSLVKSRFRFLNDDVVTRPFDWLSKDGTENYFVECLKRPVDVAFEYASTGKPVEGDCDDYASYCAALLKALGIDCSFATVAANPQNPDAFSHVYCVAYYRGTRVPMDCSHGPYVGWEFSSPGGGHRLQEWSIFDRESYGLVGLALVTIGFFVWRNRQEIGRMFS